MQGMPGVDVSFDYPKQKKGNMLNPIAEVRESLAALPVKTAGEGEVDERFEVISNKSLDSQFKLQRKPNALKLLQQQEYHHHEVDHDSVSTLSARARDSIFDIPLLDPRDE